MNYHVIILSLEFKHAVKLECLLLLLVVKNIISKHIQWGEKKKPLKIVFSSEASFHLQGVFLKSESRERQQGRGGMWQVWGQRNEDMAGDREGHTERRWRSVREPVLTSTLHWNTPVTPTEVVSAIRMEKHGDQIRLLILFLSADLIHGSDL